jgi:hypothetical protein
MPILMSRFSSFKAESAVSGLTASRQLLAVASQPLFIPTLPTPIFSLDGWRRFFNNIRSRVCKLLLYGYPLNGLYTSRKIGTYYRIITKVSAQCFRSPPRLHRIEAEPKLIFFLH